MRAALLMLLLAVASHAVASPPPASLPYQRDLTREARAVFGLNAPVPMLAAQIHQESSWRPDARSPYADGLTQFTPDTATWIAGLYPELGTAAPFNPQWAIRAMVRYDRHIYDRQALPAATECDRWAFTLAAYNGGPGWINRDRRLCDAMRCIGCCDSERWWGNVEYHTDRADWARRENRDYPRRILMTLQPRYATWGRSVECHA